MDARLSAVGLIAVGAIDDPHDLTFGRIELPWFGLPTTVDVIFERDSQDQPPNGAQIEAFCKFALKRHAFFDALEKRLFQFYNDSRTASVLDRNTIDRSFPVLIDQRQLGSLIDLTGVLVADFDGQAWSEYIGLLMECSWEREHGLGVKVVDEQVAEIGFQDIVL